MKSTLFLALTLLLNAQTTLAGPASNQQVGDRIHTFLSIQADAQVLAINHQTGAWTLFKCSAAACETVPLKVDASGTARLSSVRNSPRVVVYNTNSLVYGLQEVKAEDADVPDLAALQTAVAAIGAGVQGLLGLKVPLVFPTPTPAPTDALAKAASVAKVYKWSPMSSPSPTPVPTPPGWQLQINELRGQMQGWSDGHVDALKPLQGAARHLGSIGSQLEHNRLNILAAIQIMEDAATFELPGWESADVAAIRDAVGLLIEERNNAPALPCTGELAQLRDLMTLVATAPYKPKTLPERRVERDELVAELSEPSGSCKGGAFAITTLAAELGTRDLSQPWLDAEEWLPLRVSLVDYASMASDTAALKKKAGEAIEKGHALVPTAARIEQALRIVGNSRRGGSYYLDLIEVPGSWTLPEWDKQRTVTLTLSASAPLQESIAKTRSAPFSAKYAIETSRWRFDARVGLLLRPSDSTNNIEWDAVTDPTDSKKKAIGAVRTASRAGTPTAILTLQRTTWNDLDGSPGIDFSVGADPNRPFVALGGSLNLVSFIRLGLSYGWHKVKVLEAPQRALQNGPDGALDRASVTNIESADDIRTIERVKKGWHFTLSVSLNSLNPFK